MRATIFRAGFRAGVRPFAIALAAGSILSVAPETRAQQNAFATTILIANRPEFQPTAFVDPHMTDAWGIALRPPGAGGHIWISNAADGSTTTYIGDVNGVPLHQDGLKIVPIDQPAWTDHGYSQVTGQVYNAASDVSGQPIEFSVSGPATNRSVDPPVALGNVSGAAKFIFVTMEGTIAAWRTNTAQAMDSAVIIKDYSITSQTPLDLPIAPVHTGVAITTDAFTLGPSGEHIANNRLYVADFENDRIEVFDNQWNDITQQVHFAHPEGLPPEFHPFNIQYLGGKLYVSYAVLNPTGEEPGEDIDEPGFGHLYEFDRDGNLIGDYPEHDALNAPWGMAIAPAGFGPFGGALLVANFGDGTIAAYDRATHAYIDSLRDDTGELISIDGIWGLTFGNGVSLGDANALYFTAGPNGEEDGLFGRLNWIVPPCEANCDGSTTAPLLTAADFTCFLDRFRAGDSRANCDGSTTPPVLTASDFTCFLAKFRSGC
jgi:uncharacterized protein (TIGR03118 family)